MGKLIELVESPRFAGTPPTGKRPCSAIRRTCGIVGSVLFLAALMFSALPVAARATSGSTLSEYDVKALFLLNFTRYVEWPADAFEDPGAPFVIGIIGNDPFDGKLEQLLSGRRVHDRPIVLLIHPELEDASARCHLVFVVASAEHWIGDLSRASGERGILYVGESGDFLAKGGMINFVIRDGNVRLQINERSALEANLRISSQLLSIADMVERRR